MSTTENMVLRTVYLPPALDKRLKGIAFRLDCSKNEFIRNLIAVALENDPVASFARASIDDETAPAEPTMVLRTVYLPRDLDRRLKGIASDLGASKNEFMRHLIATSLDRYPVKPFAEETPITPSDASNVVIERIPRVRPSAKPVAKPKRIEASSQRRTAEAV